MQQWIRAARGEMAERRLWANAPTVEHVGELMAWFCLGELQSWPGHAGPTDPETREANLGPVLAGMNRRGFITLCSQPGVDLDGQGWQQRAAVDGLATPAVLAQLRGLTAGTRLQVIAHPPSRWRHDYSRAVDVTRVGEHNVTRFGSRSPTREIRFMFDGVPDCVVDELAAMWQVTIVDPEWGAESLLWDRLAAPDWDRPSPAPRRCDAPAVTPRPTNTGATVNSTIQEIRGVLAAASDVIGGAQGPIQQAIDEATRARNALMGAMDGSHQPDVEGQIAVLTAMIGHLEDALALTHQAITGNQAIGNRL